MVKIGYKQTEIGVIPDDWGVALLNDICQFIGGGTPSKKVLEYWDGDIPWISSSDLCEHDIRSININRYITEKAVSSSATQKCPPGTILIVSRVGVGKIALSNYEICTSQDFTNVVPKEHDPLFLTYLLVPIMRSKENEAQGTSIKGITTESIRQIKVSVPPVVEQECIAESLSDIDNMITSLEKLITKKKAIKQGAMQELLTGKKRLPGFSGEWRNINLSKKSKIKARIGWQGLTASEYLDSGFAYLVTGTDFLNGKIDWGCCHYVAKDRFDQDKNIQIQNNDILITKDGSLGKTALVKELNKPATLNSGVFVIRPIQESYDPTFVYYILSSFVFKDFLDHLSAGSTIIHLYQKDISKFEFAIPPTKEEQTAIASILSDIDSVIEALEQKLEKAHQIKQGMMQQLLTGKIRLM